MIVCCVAHTLMWMNKIVDYFKKDATSMRILLSASKVFGFERGRILHEGSTLGNSNGLILLADTQRELLKFCKKMRQVPM
ncbi:hypothetical protein CR513_21535, partial [Mucuna pruriens]